MSRISQAHMSKLFYRLEKSYSAGIDLLSALRRESESGSNDFRAAMKAIAERVAKGNGLAESIQSLGDYFPPLVVSIVKAGERGGRLEESFRRLSKHYESLVAFRTRILAGIAWPVFELGMAIVVCGAMILILGYLLGPGNSSGQDLSIDWFGMGLGTTGNFILYCVLVVLLLSTLFVLIFGAIKGWFGKLPMRIAKRIPLIGKTIEAMSLSRFAWTLSVAENAGMKPQESTQLALEATQNFYFTSAIDEVKSEIELRRPIHSALEKTKAFPNDFLMYVENGETAGELAETMDRVSHDLQETAERNLKTISTVGMVATVLFTALVMGAAIIFTYKRLVLDTITNMANGF